MALPSNPQTLASYDITQPSQAKIFVKKVSDLFQALSTATGLAGILNGAGALLGTAFAPSTVLTSNLFIKSVDLGTITSNQTVDCVGATSVAVACAVSTTFNPAITLAHLALGVPVTFKFNSTAGVNVTLTILATQPGGTAYTNVAWKTSTAFTNMSAGLVVATGTTLVASGSAIPTGSWQLIMVAN